jgi:hypothetical protein
MVRLIGTDRARRWLDIPGSMEMLRAVVSDEGLVNSSVVRSVIIALACGSLPRVAYCIP